MNIATKIIQTFSSSSKLFKKVNGETIEKSIEFYLLFALAELIIYFTIKGNWLNTKLTETLNLTSNQSLIHTIMVLAGLILIPLVFSFLITVFTKIYKDSVKWKDSIKITIYALTPVNIVFILTLINIQIYDFLINQKPVVLLILVIYFSTLIHSGFKTIKKMEGGHIVSSLLLLTILIFVYFRENIDVVIFYTVLIGILYWKRKKFTPAGIVLLLKTKLGLKSMDKLSQKYPKILHVLGQIGIYVGFLGMIAISITFFKNAYDLLFVANTIPGAAPILPGISIPGSPITLPLWYGLSTIFIVVLIHEFSHGVIARLYNIKVKSSGFLFMGPIIGAFVEPDDKQLAKAKTKHKLAVLGAGPFSNILLAVLAGLIVAFALNPVIADMGETNGIGIEVMENGTASQMGLETGDIITLINGQLVNSNEDIYSALNTTKPDDTINITTLENETLTGILNIHPEDENKGYLGIKPGDVNVYVKESFKEKYGKHTSTVILIIAKFFTWLFIISLGIGIANLLPLGPVDGGQMLLFALQIFYNEKKSKAIWSKVSTVTIILLLFVLFFPLMKWILGQFV